MAISKEPISWKDLVVNRFYWVKLVFPASINDPGQMALTTDAAPPIFHVEHLDTQKQDGMWHVNRQQEKVPNYFRPCVVVKLLGESESAFIMVVSSEPSVPSRWIPVLNTPPLTGEPNLSVEVSPTWDLVGHLCYTHILHVRPVLRKAAKPQVMPGIVHIAPPMFGQEVLQFSCKNMDDILALHVDYWESKRVIRTGIKDESTGDHGDKDDGSTEDGSTENEGGNKGGNKDSHNSGGSSGGSSGAQDSGESQSNLNATVLEGMPFVLEGYVEPGISLDDGEDIEMGDIAEYEKSVSSTLGMRVKVLSLQETTEKLAGSSIRVWAGYEDEDEDVSDDETVLLNGTTPVELFAMDNAWTDLNLAPILMTPIPMTPT
jgi:hypothetical protein